MVEFIGALGAAASLACFGKAAVHGCREAVRRVEAIGEDLEALYRGTVEEPVPADMLDTLAKLK